jgi:hypothetical protein
MDKKYKMSLLRATILKLGQYGFKKSKNLEFYANSDMKEYLRISVRDKSLTPENTFSRGTWDFWRKKKFHDYLFSHALFSTRIFLQI